MAPRYPLYDTQPNQGKLPCMKAMGPPDMRPTSSTASAYQTRINAAHGRWLAGLGGVLTRDPEMPFFGFSSDEHSRHLKSHCEDHKDVFFCRAAESQRNYNDLMQQMKTGVALALVCGAAAGYYFGKRK